MLAKDKKGEFGIRILCIVAGNVFLFDEHFIEIKTECRYWGLFAA